MATADRKEAMGEVRDSKEGMAEGGRRKPQKIPHFPGREVVLNNRLAKNTLHLALGMTCPNRHCLAVSPTSGRVAYPASGVAVLFDTATCKQAGYIQASTQSISCLAFSPDGQYVLLGEHGHMPALRVWSLANDQQLAQFQGHEYGVAHAAFSSKMDLLVSVGTNHDGTIFVWAWPSRNKVSCNRFAEVIYGMSFFGTDPIFVTCGAHHIRFWYPGTKISRFEQDTLLGRSVIMRDNKTRTFVDVDFGSGPSDKFVYTVTSCGLVCQINSERHVTQVHKLQNTELSSVQARDDQLIVASVYGHIHFFNAVDMQYRTSISMPVDASLTTCYTAATMEPRGSMYLGLDNKNNLLTAVLNTGELCIWDIRNLANVKRRYFSSGHNKLVCGLDIHLTQKTRLRHRETMLSVSHDGTLRQWNLSFGSRALSKINNAIFTGNYCPRNPTTCDAVVITAVKASELLGLVVIGDSKGLVTVYEAKSLQVLDTINRHSRSITIIHIYSGTVFKNCHLMLTGGRDRLINVYDVRKSFQVLNSLSLHSGSISALGMLEGPGCLMLLSSALDRSVILSCTSKEDPHRFMPRQCRHTTCSVVDIHVCPSTHWAVLGRINTILTVLNTQPFKSMCTFRACADRNAQLEKLHVGADGSVLVTACSDRSINLMSLPFGVRLASFTGHAAPVSGLMLCVDMRQMVSASRDGCIFVWGLPAGTRERALHLFKNSLCKFSSKIKRNVHVTRDARSFPKPRAVVQAHEETNKTTI